VGVRALSGSTTPFRKEECVDIESARIASKPVDDRGPPAWGKISLSVALPASLSIAFPRCSMTAWSAVLAAISGCWTGRF